MKHPARVLPVLICLLAAPVFGQNTGLTDDEVNAAYTACKQQKTFVSMYVEATGKFAAPYTVLLQGPVGRTMDIARVAFEAFKPFAASSIGPTVRAHEVTFTVYGHGQVPRVVNLVILPPNATSRDEAIQPLEDRVIWQDKSPRTYAEQFNYHKEKFFRFSEASIPPGDIQLVVVSEGGGQERYTVKSIDRERIK